MKRTIYFISLRGILNRAMEKIKIFICPIGEIKITVSSHKIRRNTNHFYFLLEEIQISISPYESFKLP